LSDVNDIIGYVADPATEQYLRETLPAARVLSLDEALASDGVVVAAATAARELLGDACLATVVLLGTSDALAAVQKSPRLAGLVPLEAGPRVLQTTAATALALARARRELRAERDRLAWQSRLTAELNRVGVALSAERDAMRLLELIVTTSRELTQSDAASLYLAEPDGAGGTRLRFKFAQNYSVNVPLAEFTIPISPASIAGFVAETGYPLGIEDVYELPPEAPYGFNRSFDLTIGYRTRSMLVVPLLDAAQTVLGVLQLINHKTSPTARITDSESASRWVTPYPAEMASVAASLGSQAAVALENSLLYQDIRNLFEGFVRASVTAIEQRDPTTSGHSERVADLTVGLAELVDRADSGRYRDVRFSRDQLTEVRYASLLHDFGKVGVREHVLVKAKKLYPHQLELLRWRFDSYRKSVQLEAARRSLETGAVGQDAELIDRLADIDRMWETILRSNEPTVLAEGSSDQLAEIARQTVPFGDGETPLLTAEEVRALSVPRGSARRRRASRDRITRQAHVRLSVEDPLDKGVARHSPHRRLPSREVEWNGLSVRAGGRVNPPAVANDDHIRHLRRPDGLGPSLQTRRSGRSSPRYPQRRGWRRTARLRAARDVHRGSGLRARARLNGNAIGRRRLSRALVQRQGHALRALYDQLNYLVFEDTARRGGDPRGGRRALGEPLEDS
jgi:hypothetical protein